MVRHRRTTRRITALAALSAAFAVSAIAPSLASGQNVVNDLLQGLGLGGGGGAAPAQGEEDPNKYQPPLHGDNPHGQGTVGTLDVLPSSELPYSGDPAGGPAGGDGCEDPRDCEEVVIGRSRGEKENPYHGHVTILALFGNEIAGIDTEPGQSDEFGPLNPVLTPICTGSQGVLCLGILQAKSETTDNSSKNHFQFFGFSSQSQLGRGGISLFESNGNIEEDQNCQRSEGNSSAAHVSASRNGTNGTETRQTDGFDAAVASSSAKSEACNNAAPTQTNESSILLIDGEEVIAPCEEETLFSLGIFALGCSNDDTNGEGEQVQQAPVPYGVREAFNFFLVPLFLGEESVASRQTEDGPLALLKLTVAASESHAKAPPKPPELQPTPPSGPAGAGAGGQAGQQGGAPAGEEGPGGPVAEAAGPGRPDLAFTGSDLLIVGLIGIGLVMAGLATSRIAVRHRRATV
jgi:hypothetical protein